VVYVPDREDGTPFGLWRTWTWQNVDCRDDFADQFPVVTDALIWQLVQARTPHSNSRVLRMGQAAARRAQELTGFQWLSPAKSEPSEAETHWVSAICDASYKREKYVVNLQLRVQRATPSVQEDAGGDLDTRAVVAKVSHAHCTCIAGMSGVCWHVIYLLFVLRYLPSYSVADPSCTSVLCKWISRHSRFALRASGPARFVTQIRQVFYHDAPLSKRSWFTDAAVVDVGGRAAGALAAKERAMPAADPVRQALAARTFALFSSAKRPSAMFSVRVVGGKRHAELAALPKDDSIARMAALISDALELPDGAPSGKLGPLPVLVPGSVVASASRTAFRPWAQHHPDVRMPNAREPMDIPADPALPYLCPVCGPRKSVGHFTAEGRCSHWEPGGRKDKLRLAWTNKWKHVVLPLAGQSFRSAQPPSAPHAGRKRLRAEMARGSVDESVCSDDDDSDL
jgi:hypothetical protein